jgi:hypothetical protein
MGLASPLSGQGSVHRLLKTRLPLAGREGVPGFVSSVKLRVVRAGSGFRFAARIAIVSSGFHALARIYI